MPSTSSLLEQLGVSIRALRVRQNLDQRTVAERAGIAHNAVRNLESGRPATTESLMKVLQVLEKSDWVAALAPAVSINPMQMLRTKRPRQRASRPR